MKVISVAVVEPSLPLAKLGGISARHQQRLGKLGIFTVADLLLHLPRRHADTRNIVSISQLRPGETATVQARIRTVSMRRSPRRGMILVEAKLQGEGGSVSAIWFNQPFLAKQLVSGMEVLLSGKIEASALGLQFRNPSFERVSGEQQHLGRLAPIYPETEGLTSKFLRSLIEPLLPAADLLTDPIPEAVRTDEGLMPLGQALRSLHHPSIPEEVDRARERMAFEELFLLQLAAERARRRRLTAHGAVIPYDVELARNFSASLPFKLTNQQRQSGHEILTDMAATGPMNRLLQGDVGSGKTVVAALAALMARAAGFQVAVMAPTEILARQHYATLDRLLTPHGLPPRLLVGSTSERARREVLEGLAGGHDFLVVGTHALIEDDVVLMQLGLVVVDEQHRFGVSQRQKLRLKAELQPNFLAMTATPIPRSLALTLYGDVNVSEIRELPPGRIPVETQVVPPTLRDDAYTFVREQIRGGRQAFVICPLIEESDKLGVRSATAEYERLQKDVFPDLRVELLHGRMSAREKEERMARFTAGTAHILVSTSVVEVGVDVPNATVMLIEGAERFGIAQLHQFRGRVGRGAHKSFCMLFETNTDQAASDRLAGVAAIASGFELAELDLRQRGAGDVAGLRQHGLPEMRAADLLDVALAQRARGAASTWLDRDPDLSSHSPLQQAMSKYNAVFDLD